MKGFPASLLHDLQTIDGFDASAFMAAHRQPAVTSIRLHPVKKIAGFNSSPAIPWCAQGRYLAERPVFTLHPAYHAGAYYVQEASSMFLDHMLRQLLPLNEDLRVLDLCAAPGGKSTLMAALLSQGSLLVCNDVIRTRAAILEENMTRWGYMNTWVSSNDPRDFGKIGGYFDAIVVDAPCSGSGLFRKDTRALDEWSEANVQLCSHRQRRILADVWPALKQDGMLIYATCSYSPQEDEEILDWMAGNFQLETLSVDCPPEWGVITVTSPECHAQGYRFFPDKLEGEGFFIAAMRKKTPTQPVKLPKHKASGSRNILDMLAPYIERKDITCIETEKNSYAAINTLHEQDFLLLNKALYLRKTGLVAGSPAGKEWIPHHALALSIDVSEQVPYINVTKEQALLFLKKEEFLTGVAGKGWYLIKYENLGLGWIKHLGNRINNYLPKNWRIRMEINDGDWA